MITLSMNNINFPLKVFMLTNSHKDKVFDFVFNLLLFPFFFVDESNSNCKIKPIYSQNSITTKSKSRSTLLGLSACLWDQT